MSHAKAGPKELALRAQREEKAARPKKLIPYAGQENLIRGPGKNKGGRPLGSINRPKWKAKR